MKVGGATHPSLPLAQRALRALIALAVGGGLALLAISSPSTRTSPLPCGLHALTGLPCPFCGGTRAARAVLSGNWGRALYLNALAFPALALIVGIAAVLLGEAVAARRLLPWPSALGWISHRGPLLFVLALVWWMPHLLLALRTPKAELVDLRNPIAAGLRSRVAPERDAGK